MRALLKSLNYSKISVPAFIVNRDNTDQTNITGTDKVEWTNKVLDTTNDFDAITNYRFTPSVQGIYLFSFSTRWLSASVTVSDVVHYGIYKNGTLLQENYRVLPTVTDTLQTVTTISQANGTTDYFEIFSTNDNRDTGGLDGNSEFTFWIGCKI